MTERVLFIVWGLWLLMILWAAFRVFGFSFARRWQERRWGDGSKNQQPVAVIVPVKGFDLQDTPRFFDALFSQDYARYRVLVTFESWSDPVAVWLRQELELNEADPVGPTWKHPDPGAGSGPDSITLVCAGVSQQEGQKVHNQRAAFQHLEKDDAVIAFADGDIHPKEDWLARLTAPINQGTHPLATTYRWLVPKRPTLPNQIASVINGSITTQGGSELTNVLWGGSMAISREVFDQLDVPKLFTGSLNDDLRLSKAARRAGNRIAFVRSLVLPTSVDFTWRSFFEFAKRQYTQVKFFSPILYTGTNLVLAFYALGLVSVIGAIVYGYFYAWVPLAAAYVIDQFRGLARQQVYLSLFPENGIRRRLFAACWLEHMLTPLWMMIHWLIVVSTWTQSRIRWAGVSYRILGVSKTRILDRPVTTEKLPVGVPGLALVSQLHDRRRVPVETKRPPEAAPAASPDAAPTEKEKEAKKELVTAGSPDQGEREEETPSAKPEKKPKDKAGKKKKKKAKKTKQKKKAAPSEKKTKASPPPASAGPVSHPGLLPGVTPLAVRRESPPAPRKPGKPSPGRKPGRTFLETRLERTRVRPFVPHPTPAPPAAAVSTPSPPEAKPEPAPQKPAGAPSAAAASLFATPSAAARRVAGIRRDLRVGTVGKRRAQSSRANQVSRSGHRGSRQTRPVNRRPSGRSR